MSPEPQHIWRNHLRGFIQPLKELFECQCFDLASLFQTFFEYKGGASLNCVHPLHIFCQFIEILRAYHVVETEPTTELYFDQL